MCLASPALADHAIAMHGQPKYAAGFKAFDYVNADAPKGGTLRRSEIGTFDNLNPFLITGRVTPGLQEALLLTYDSLMTRAWNEPFTMYGSLAEKVTVPKARNWIEFTLDKEARFHDGLPVSTADVEFSYQALMKHGRPNQRRIYKLISKVTIKNKQVIRFDLGPGYDRETVMILASMPVLPKHYWATQDFGKTTLKPPLTSGPYRIKSVDVGRRVIFERVPDYWGRDKGFARGLYNFDRLQYDFFRDDNVALQALAAGQADLRREWSAVNWEQKYQFLAIEQGTVIKEEFDNGRPMRAKFFVFNMRREPFNDVNVRKALNHAFDFEWLNKNLFLGTQKRVSGLFTNSELADDRADRFVPAVTPDRDALRQNLREAIALLKQSGWELRNGRMEKDGIPLQFEILLNDISDEKVAIAWARTLKRIGITAAIRTVDTAQFIGRLSQFDYDVTSYSWRNSLSPGTEQAVYWGSAAADNQGSFNYSGLKSPTVDGLISRLTQAEKREDLVTAARGLDHAVMQEWIGLPLYDSPKDRVAYKKGLKHPEITPLYGPVIESWWYEPAKSVK